MGFGGSAANTAVMLSRLGIRATLVACVGDDDWGRQAVEGLRAQGVGTDLVRRSADEATSLNVIAVTPDGERTMFAYRGASAELRADDVPPTLAGAAHLHVSGYALLADPQRSAATAAMAAARRAGMTVSLDVPVDPVAAAPDLLLEAFGAVDAVVIGAREARQLTGADHDEAAARLIAERGPAIVALTGGATGSLLHAEGKDIRAPVPRVSAVDTTGAGDSFCAGLIFAIRRGIPDPERAALANACGASAVGVAGAGACLPDLDGILRAVRGLPVSMSEDLIARIDDGRGAA
jgi:ribokinase